MLKKTEELNSRNHSDNQSFETRISKDEISFYTDQVNVQKYQNLVKQPKPKFK